MHSPTTARPTTLVDRAAPAVAPGRDDARVAFAVVVSAEYYEMQPRDQLHSGERAGRLRPRALPGFSRVQPARLRQSRRRLPRDRGAGTLRDAGHGRDRCGRRHALSVYRRASSQAQFRDRRPRPRRHQRHLQPHVRERRAQLHRLRARHAAARERRTADRMAWPGIRRIRAHARRCSPSSASTTCSTGRTTSSRS